MRSTARASLPASVSETVRGSSLSANSSPMELRPWDHVTGEQVGTPCKSDFANSLAQETSQQVIGFVSGSGVSCFHVQAFAVGLQPRWV